MKLSQFKIRIPQELFAQRPPYFRDECRLMVLHRKTGKLQHKHFSDLLSYFKEGDHFVFNDTKVFPARYVANKENTGAIIDVFLQRELNPELHYWDVIVEPARKIRIGNKLFFGEDTSIFAEVINNTNSRGRTIRFLTDQDHDEFKAALYKLGKMPLPKYITREADEQDVIDYQTIYADKEGAIAAPATGLHFSRGVLKKMEILGIERDIITSHIGLCNYRDIEVEDLTKFKMESDELIIGPEMVDVVDRMHEEKRNLVAVGIDVLRGLETVVGTDGHIKSYNGWTNKFMFPPYKFTTANALLTNFYPSESILQIMTFAFGGYDEMMHAYEMAIKEKYQFGDYGDALLSVD